MEELLRTYGYVALLVGTFFEGETAILVASSLIYNGFFQLLPTILFGFLGSFISDWLYFFIGRANGKLFIDRRPKLKAKVAPLTNFFERHQLQVLFTYRFLYGFRVLIPVVIGMSRIRLSQFFLYSVVAGLMWASVVSMIGYAVGRMFELTPRLLADYIFFIIPGFAFLGLLFGFLMQAIFKKQLAKEQNQS